MQIICHLPTIKIIVPPNVGSYYETVIPIVTFDILESTYSTELVLEFDNDLQEEKSIDIFDQMKDLGYSNHNLIQIIGSLGILMLIHFILAIIYIIVLYPLKQVLTTQKSNVERFFRRTLFYDWIIKIAQGGYLEFFFAMYLNLKMPIYTKPGEYMSLWFSYYTLMVTCIFIPVAWSKIMLTELLTIQNSRKFNRKWSALYEGIKTKSKVTIAFYFIYYLRRLFFCILVITNTEITMLKVQVVMLSNLFIMIY